ncbi:MAG: MarR family winged helix-turn-helix transcriptional regulator [Phycisphaerae bacterium]
MKSKPRRLKGGAGEAGARVPAVGEWMRGGEGHIGYLLRQAAAAVRGEMDAAFAEIGVTSPQFVVMTMVQAYAGISNAALARVAMLTPQTVNMIVRNLEGRRLLEKAADPGHGRILQLRLTEKGAAVLAECRRRSQKVQSRMVSGLKREEEGVVRKWLVYLAEMGAGRE